MKSTLKFEKNVLDYLVELSEIASYLPRVGRTIDGKLLFSKDHPEYCDDPWLAEVSLRARPTRFWDFLRYAERYTNAVEQSAYLQIAETLALLYQHHVFYVHQQYGYRHQLYVWRETHFENLHSTNNYLESHPDARSRLENFRQTIEADYRLLSDALHYAYSQVEKLVEKFWASIYGESSTIPVVLRSPFVETVEKYQNIFTTAVELRSRLPLPEHTPYPGTVTECLLDLQDQTAQKVSAFYYHAARHIGEYTSAVANINAAVNTCNARIEAAEVKFNAALSSRFPYYPH